MADKITAEKTIEDRVEAPVQQVWDLLSDFSAITRRTAGIQDFRIEGEGAGAIRSFRVGDGPILRERIELWDPANYRFAYALLPPAFMDDHYSEIRMRADGPESCVIEWMGRCSVASEEEVAPRFLRDRLSQRHRLGAQGTGHSVTRAPNGSDARRQTAREAQKIASVMALSKADQMC